MRGSQRKVHKLIGSNHKITDLQTMEKKTSSEQANFLDTLQTPKLSDDKCLLCKGELTESELNDALKNMPNNKYPGNDGLLTTGIKRNSVFWKDKQLLN